MRPGPSRETESEIPQWVNGAGEEVFVSYGGPARHRRRRGHWGRRILVGIGILVVVGVLAAAGAVVWINDHLNGAGGAPITVSLPARAGHATLASDLARAGAISDAWLFRRYLDYRSYPPIDGGEYTLHRHEGYRAALHDLGAGPKILQYRLTIPEGYDLRQIAEAVGRLPGLSAQRFLQVAQSGAVRSAFEPAGSDNLEGLLFPDTYFVDRGETEQDVLQAMVTRFDQIAARANLSGSAAATGLTPYQTIIVASIVEREAKVDQDRGKIARVVLNRLAAKMRLQIDATVEYALGVHKTKLTDSDLRVQSPYNTYLVAGLPPGPIASPGEASLAAAVGPTPGPWLYYVLLYPDGRHGFATTSAEFQRLLQQARANGAR
jgi:peptidoglycan lytic transglycosylase G